MCISFILVVLYKDIEYNRNPNDYFHYQTWYQAAYLLTPSNTYDPSSSFFIDIAFRSAVDLLHATIALSFLQLQVTLTCFFSCVDPHIHLASLLYTPLRSNRSPSRVYSIVFFATICLPTISAIIFVSIFSHLRFYFQKLCPFLLPPHFSFPLLNN